MEGVVLLKNYHDNPNKIKDIVNCFKKEIRLDPSSDFAFWVLIHYYFDTGTSFHFSYLEISTNVYLL